MSRWFRFDCNAVRHPKVMGLTDGEFRVWVELVSYAAEHGTDGTIPEAWFKSNRVTGDVRDRLSSVGLLDNIDGAWILHDYLDHQPPAAYWDKRKEAGKKGAAKRWANADANGTRMAGAMASAMAPAMASANATTTNTSTTTESIDKDNQTTFAPGGRDDIWRGLFAATIEAVGGESPKTRSEQGKYAQAVDELRRIGATPEDVAVRAAEYRKCYTVPLTPASLVRNWGSLAPRIARRPERFGRSRVIGGGS